MSFDAHRRLLATGPQSLNASMMISRLHQRVLDVAVYTLFQHILYVFHILQFLPRRPSTLQTCNLLPNLANDIRSPRQGPEHGAHGACACIPATQYHSQELVADLLVRSTALDNLVHEDLRPLFGSLC